MANSTRDWQLPVLLDRGAVHRGQLQRRARALAEGTRTPSDATWRGRAATTAPTHESTCCVEPRAPHHCKTYTQTSNGHIMHVQSQLSSSAHRDLVPADEQLTVRNIPSLAWDHRYWWRQSSKDYPSDASHWSVGFLPTNLPRSQLLLLFGLELAAPLPRPSTAVSTGVNQ